MTTTTNDEELLQSAIESKNETMFRSLLPCKPSGIFRDQQQRTFMHMCAKTGHIEMGKELKRLGVQLESGDRQNQSPLHVAVAEGHYSFARWLLAEGAAVDPLDGHGDTPLFYAVRRLSIEGVIMLVELGASPFHRNAEGRTALDEAESLQFQPCIFYLTEVLHRSEQLSESHSKSLFTQQDSEQENLAQPTTTTSSSCASSSLSGARKNGTTSAPISSTPDPHINSVLLRELNKTETDIIAIASVRKSLEEAAASGQESQIAALQALLHLQEERTRRRSASILQMSSSSSSASASSGTAEKKSLVRRTVGVKVQETEYHRLQADLEKTSKEISSLLDGLRQRETALRASEEQNLELRAQLGDFYMTPEQIRADVELRADSCVRVAQMRDDVDQMTQDCGAMQATVQDWQHQFSQHFDLARAKIEEMNERKNGKLILARRFAPKVMEERRALWEQLQQLRGAWFRVFCRLSPCPSHQKSVLRLSKQHLSQVTLESAVEAPKRFLFDAVFDSHAPHAHIFNETKHALNALVDEGQNVSIVAYGQPKTGKSYTLHGSEEINGLAHLALSYVFDRLKEKPAHAHHGHSSHSHSSHSTASASPSYRLEMSVVQIDDESIRCLFSQSSGQRLHIQQGSHGEVEIAGAHWQSIVEQEDVAALLAAAQSSAASRSTKAVHTLTMARVEGYNATTRRRFTAKLIFADLAPSSRFSKQVPTSKSLSTMEHLLSLLQRDSAAEVPYRNSSLTHLLQDSFAPATAKTIFLFHVDPSESSYSESLQLLQFSADLRSIFFPGDKSKTSSPSSSSSSSLSSSSSSSSSSTTSSSSSSTTITSSTRPTTRSTLLKKRT